MGEKNIIFLVIFGLGLCLLPLKSSFAQGAEAFNNSGLPIPRFVTLNKDKVFVRTGPALRYPIKWIFVRAGMPIEIVQEFDTWRKIRDIDGDEGWVHQSLLSGKRNAIVMTDEEDVIIRRKPSLDARAVAKLENDVQVAVEQCHQGWCQVEAGGFLGWIENNLLWGVYGSEELD